MTDHRVDGAQARVLLRALGVESDHIGETVTLDELLRELGKSDRLVVHDWRGELGEGLDALVAIMRDYGHDVSYECDDAAARAEVTCAGKTATVAYLPDEHDFTQVAAALSKLIHGRVEFRSTASGLESDTFELIGLSSDEWRKLDRAIPALVKRVFPAVTARSA